MKIITYEFHLPYEISKLSKGLYIDAMRFLFLIISLLYKCFFLRMLTLAEVYYNQFILIDITCLCCKKIQRLQTFGYHSGIDLSSIDSIDIERTITQKQELNFLGLSQHKV